MKETNKSASKCDDELKAAVEAWRKQHQLREDDAVLLLTELLKIHQDHWEELRRKDLPGFEAIQKDIQSLLVVNQTLRSQAKALAVRLAKLGTVKDTTTVTRTAAWLAAVAGALGGVLLGRLLK